MICKLCLQEKELCKSHIISEFFYSEIYDEKHRFLSISESPLHNNKEHQLGIREKLLCYDCEQLLGKNEHYAKELLYDKKNAQIIEDSHAFVYQHVNYSRFKTFQLSLLWRLHITTLPDYRYINLGPHANRIRAMILHNNPGKYHDYGCIMATVETHSKIENKMMLMPRAIRFAGHNGFLCMFGGFFWFYIVSSHSALFSYKETFLSEEGRLVIQKDTQGILQDMLQDAITNIKKTEIQRQKRKSRNS